MNELEQDRPPLRGGPLDGIVVADFTRVLAGPLATMTLGDLGADVVKVERPGAGDETRGWQPPTAANGQSTYFLAVNRNKRSIALDLSTSEGRSAAKELALRADVVVENFRPGTMERFGLGYEALAAQRSTLIYASLTSFGPDGGDAAGYDFLVQAVGGLMSITGFPDGDPTKVGVAVVDVLAGQNLVTGILAALFHRERTGLGQRVEVNLMSSVLAGLINQASAYLNAGVVPGRLGNRHPSIAPYQAVAAADRLVVLAVGNDGQFLRLAEVLAAEPNQVDLGRDPRFATNALRVTHVDALTEVLHRALAARPAAYWVDRFTTAGVPCGAVNTVADAFDLADSLGLRPVVRLHQDDGAEVAGVACPIDFSLTPVTYRVPPPGSLTG